MGVGFFQNPNQKSNQGFGVGFFKTQPQTQNLMCFDFGFGSGFWVCALGLCGSGFYLGFGFWVFQNPNQKSKQGFGVGFFKNQTQTQNLMCFDFVSGYRV